MATYEGKKGTKARRPKAKGSNARPMTDAQLVALIAQRSAKATPASELNDQRAEALKYYFGEDFGDEVEGRSSVVMREVYGVIEWIMPALMKIFFGGENVVKFTPKSAADVAGAEQETEYIHHVVADQNDGFMLIQEWFKDALLSANSYIHAYWEKRQDTTVSRYEGLSEEALTAILSEPGTEIIDQSVDAETGTLTISIRSSISEASLCLETIPAERMRVDNHHKHVSLRKSRFVEYWEEMTLSEVRELGFDVDDSISDADDGTGIEDTVEVIREEKIVDFQDEGDADPASRIVRVYNAYLRVDYDGDGVAELRHVIRIGKQVLHNDYFDIIPIASITPTLVPHRHVGMSYAEVVMDLQRIKSALIRGLLDNLNLANAGRWFIDEDRVDWDDFLANRPGGGVRVQGGVANAAMPFNSPVLGAPVIQSLEYMDNVLENRTGASPRVLQGQSFDGNAINRTATGINAVMSAAMARVEMIARMFASGFSDLCLIAHALTLKNERRPQILQLRGEFVEIDPRTWERRTAMSIDTGIGTGDRQERIASLQMLVTAQQGLLQMGLASPQTMYNALVRLTRAMGYKDIESFWVNPAQDPNMAQRLNEPPPEVKLEQAKLASHEKIEMAKVNARLKDVDARMQQVIAQLGSQKEIAMLNAIAQLQGTAMSEDNKMRAAGLLVDDQPRTRKTLRHVRGPDGRISHSELVEIPEDETAI